MKKPEDAVGIYEALNIAAHQFRKYENLHAAKGEDGREKAETNRRYAEMCERAFQEGTHSRFPMRVHRWMLQCFGTEITYDIRERCDRFLEEALELIQALGYPRARIAKLVEYVYGRPAGEINQEIGGVMVTLAALGNAVEHDILMAALMEARRIEDPVMMARIREKQKGKKDIHGPLP